MDKKFKLVIVEDNVDTATFLQMELEDAGYDIVLAKDGQQGAIKVKQEAPDLVIMDWEMPIMTGLDLCKHVRKSSNVPILMLTAKKEVKEKVAGLDAGANDYLVKPFDSDELLARVRSLIRASKTFEKTELEFENILINTKTCDVYSSGELIELSKKEFDLLYYFLQHPNQVLSKAQIFEKVWGWDMDGSEGSVEVYVHSLRNKLEKNEGERLIHTKRGIGYILKKV